MITRNLFSGRQSIETTLLFLHFLPQWMYIVPLVLFLMMSGAQDQSGGGAGGGAANGGGR